MGAQGEDSLQWIPFVCKGTHCKKKRNWYAFSCAQEAHVFDLQLLKFRMRDTVQRYSWDVFSFIVLGYVPIVLKLKKKDFSNFCDYLDFCASPYVWQCLYFLKILQHCSSVCVCVCACIHSAAISSPSCHHVNWLFHSCCHLGTVKALHLRRKNKQKLTWYKMCCLMIM